MGGSRLAGAESVVAKSGFCDRLAPSGEYLKACRGRADEILLADRHRERESLVRQLFSDADKMLAGTGEGGLALAFHGVAGVIRAKPI